MKLIDVIRPNKKRVIRRRKSINLLIPPIKRRRCNWSAIEPSSNIDDAHSATPRTSKLDTWDINKVLSALNFIYDCFRGKTITNITEAIQISQMKSKVMKIHIIKHRSRLASKSKEK